MSERPTEADIRRWGAETRRDILEGNISPDLLQAAEDALNRWAMAPLPPWSEILKAAPKARIVGIGGKRFARLALLLALLAAPAVAEAHDIYADWKIPGTNTSCCHDKDCRPTDFCALPNGGEGIIVAGQCLPIQYSRVIQDQPPDGRPHVCYSDAVVPPLAVYCISLPAGA